MALATVGAAQVVRTADLAGTFLFAVEGALTGLAVGFDPVGVIVLAFLTALGGGMIRDLLIGATPPAAVADWHYAAIVIAAALVTWIFHAAIARVPDDLMVALDAAGLAMAAVAGTEKALVHRIHPLVATFLGTVSGAGGGTLRDIAINQVPRVFRTDVYATAALSAAVIVVVGRLAGVRPRVGAIVAALACIAIRMLAHAYHWHLPTVGRAGPAG
ncbi:trimeric intracellular cation channel family protein [Flavisphingomonas formosensis]|uniref:trimeric intracellular cation channel family protein n=1 Tax=Flavisphingomonas formosensis TaxID=861534 RepID=UPI0012FB19C5|nr:TRIC cation channel family protein [Sphingomonas formosensis]